jgi:Fe/S biogenesis protein NfuA
MIKFDDAAKQKLFQLLEGKDPNHMGLRLKLQGESGLEITPVELDKLSGGAEPLRDKITHFFVEYEGFMVIVDAAGQKVLSEAQVHYESGGVLSGQFTFLLPEPIPAKVYEGPNLKDPLTQQVAQLLETEINPGLAMHGGRAELLNVLDHKVYLRFGGGCQGCSMIDATVKQGIENRIKQVIPQITGVVDETDHAAGANPYFT